MKKITIAITLIVFSLVFSGCQLKPSANVAIQGNTGRVIVIPKSELDSNQPAVNVNQDVEMENSTIGISTSTLKIVKRVPEGTTSSLVDKQKVVHGELKSVSVFFNNSIDQSSISNDTFYVLWGIEDKVPGTIVYNDELKEITIIFDMALLGGNPGQEAGISVVVGGLRDIYGNIFGKFVYGVDIGK
ncbi:MAG: hypothetical protein JW816_02220 [Candidatus Buchananbacteria bacterium]|nr:hypothetical protein [Candidatus Buchananbacteria bacterium]